MSFLSDDEEAWLKFADRLDAYMWAQHHRPWIMGRDGWPEARSALEAMAEDLGVTKQIEGVL